MCTLIGTSTNLIVNSIAVAGALAAFGLFEFARLGLVMSAVGIGYLAVVGRFVLPKRSGASQQIDKYRLSDSLAEFRVAEGSPLVGKTWGETQAAAEREMQLISLIRWEKTIWQPSKTGVAGGDILLVQGDADKLMRLEEIRLDGSDSLLLQCDAASVQRLMRSRNLVVTNELTELHLRRNRAAVTLAILGGILALAASTSFATPWVTRPTPWSTRRVATASPTF